MYKLVIQDDEGKTTVVPLIRDELTIGRQEGNTIRLTERNVSRRHARVLRQSSAITIEDLNSYNGIRVNGTRIQGRCPIRESDRVQIGDYLIEIRSEAVDNKPVATADQDDKTIPMERVDPMAVTPVPTQVPEAATIPMPAKMPEASPPGAFSAPRTEKLQAAEVARAPRAAGNGRLVVLSTDFAGREFELDKPAMVIGRTDENEIWINHGSISRHHAKLVRENGRYAIVDLQSANGVRVNGEEYGKVDLRRGDLIDLGHVRLRFVEPGEDFVFGRDAHPVDISGQSSRKRLWMFVALLAVGGIVLALTVGRRDSGEAAAGAESGDASETASAGTIPPSPRVGPAVIDAAAPPPVEPPEDNNLAVHLDAARGAIAAEKWAEAQEHAKAALAIDPKHEKAKEYKEQAEIELGNSLTFADFTEAVRQKKWASIAALYAKIDEDSVYKLKAQAPHGQAKDEYISNHVRPNARRFAERHQCKKLAKYVAAVQKLVGNLWPEAVEAAKVPCTEAVAAVRNNPTKTNNKPDGGGSDTSSRPPPGNAAQLIGEAKNAAKGGQHGKALRTCQDALRLKPGDQEALTVCVIAACNLKRGNVAKRYIGQLNSSRQGMVRSLCIQRGISLD